MFVSHSNFESTKALLCFYKLPNWKAFFPIIQLFIQKHKMLNNFYAANNCKHLFLVLNPTTKLLRHYKPPNLVFFLWETLLNSHPTRFTSADTSRADTWAPMCAYTATLNLIYVCLGQLGNPTPCQALINSDRKSWNNGQPMTLNHDLKQRPN